MRDLYLSQSAQLPVCTVRYEEILGRSGRLACQGDPQ